MSSSLEMVTARSGQAPFK